DRNVVAGVADETVDQKTIADRLRDLALDSRHHACRRFRMPADGADVSLDDGKCESHEHSSGPAQLSAYACTGCAGRRRCSLVKGTSDVPIGSPQGHALLQPIMPAMGFLPPYDARLRKIGSPRLLA